MMENALVAEAKKQVTIGEGYSSVGIRKTIATAYKLVTCAILLCIVVDAALVLAELLDAAGATCRGGGVVCKEGTRWVIGTPVTSVSLASTGPVDGDHCATAQVDSMSSTAQCPPEGCAVEVKRYLEGNHARLKNAGLVFLAIALCLELAVVFSLGIAHGKHHVLLLVLDIIVLVLRAVVEAGEFSETAAVVLFVFRFIRFGMTCLVVGFVLMWIESANLRTLDAALAAYVRNGGGAPRPSKVVIERTARELVPTWEPAVELGFKSMCNTIDERHEAFPLRDYVMFWAKALLPSLAQMRSHGPLSTPLLYEDGSGWNRADDNRLRQLSTRMSRGEKLTPAEEDEYKRLKTGFDDFTSQGMQHFGSAPTSPREATSSYSPPSLNQPKPQPLAKMAPPPGTNASAPATATRRTQQQTSEPEEDTSHAARAVPPQPVAQKPTPPQQPVAQQPVLSQPTAQPLSTESHINTGRHPGERKEQHTSHGISHQQESARAVSPSPTREPGSPTIVRDFAVGICCGGCGAAVYFPVSPSSPRIIKCKCGYENEAPKSASRPSSPQVLPSTRGVPETLSQTPHKQHEPQHEPSPPKVGVPRHLPSADTSIPSQPYYPSQPARADPHALQTGSTASPYAPAPQTTAKKRRPSILNSIQRDPPPQVYPSSSSSTISTSPDPANLPTWAAEQSVPMRRAMLPRAIRDDSVFRS